MYGKQISSIDARASAHQAHIDSSDSRWEDIQARADDVQRDVEAEIRAGVKLARERGDFREPLIPGIAYNSTEPHECLVPFSRVTECYSWDEHITDRRHKAKTPEEAWAALEAEREAMVAEYIAIYARDIAELRSEAEYDDAFGGDL